MPGDIRLSEFEQELLSLWGDCFQRKPRGFRGTSAISYLVDHIVAERQIDYVFYDAGPNIGPLNRVVLLDCDFFVVPAACDLFSIRALKTLGHSLSNWINDWQTILELAPTNTRLLPGQPRFLGYIVQRFKVYGEQVASDYAKYLPRIEKSIRSDVVTVLRSLGEDLAPVAMAPHKLGEAKDFASIANASQAEGVPMKDVSAGTPTQRQEAEKCFLSIARAIVARTGAT